MADKATRRSGLFSGELESAATKLPGCGVHWQLPVEWYRSRHRSSAVPLGVWGGESQAWRHRAVQQRVFGRAVRSARAGRSDLCSGKKMPCPKREGGGGKGGVRTPLGPRPDRWSGAGGGGWSGLPLGPEPMSHRQGHRPRAWTAARPFSVVSTLGPKMEKSVISKNHKPELGLLQAVQAKSCAGSGLREFAHACRPRPAACPQPPCAHAGAGR